MHGNGLGSAHHRDTTVYVQVLATAIVPYNYFIPNPIVVVSIVPSGPEPEVNRWYSCTTRLLHQWSHSPRIQMRSWIL
jgi:hypothetical protein